MLEMGHHVKREIGCARRPRPVLDQSDEASAHAGTAHRRVHPHGVQPASVGPRLAITTGSDTHRLGTVKGHKNRPIRDESPPFILRPLRLEGPRGPEGIGLTGQCGLAQGGENEVIIR